MQSHKPLPEDIPLDPNALLRVGIVLSVDLTAARCIVRIGDPENGAIETPGIRWGASRVGKTRIWSPPVSGEQVLVACPAGEIAAGIIITSIASNEFPPAGDSDPDRIRFEDGASLAYDANNSIMHLSLPAGGGIVIDAPEMTLTGNLVVHGDIGASGDIAAAGDVTAGTVSLKTHKHIQVQPGSGQSGAPAP